MITRDYFDIVNLEEQLLNKDRKQTQKEPTIPEESRSLPQET